MSSTNFNNKADNYKWIILLIATFAQTCATFVTYGIGPLATFYSEQYNLSQFETGLMVSAVNIGPIFSMLIFGNFMDKNGERWIVGLGSILLGLSMLIAYPITEYFYLLIVLALVGIWYGTAQPGGSSAIVNWFPKDKHRGLAMGIRQTGIPLGGALASAVLPFFFYHYGLPSAILVQAAVAIIGGIIFLILYRDHGVNINQVENYSFVEKLNKIKNNVNLYPVFFIGITMISLQLIILAHLMSYLTNTLDLSLNISGGLLSLTLFGGMFGRIILAWISDRLFNGNRSKPLQLTILLTAITLIILIYLLPFLPMWGISILCFLLGFLGLGWFSLFIVLMSEKSDPNFIGLTVSFGLTLNQIFIVLAPSLFGLLVDYFNSYKIPFFLLTVLICIGGIWLALTDRNQDHKIFKSKDISHH
ncbi:MFS transporter [Bacillus cereus]|uniref:MFS transporter n=1 Tax=Bacillus cereus TaxID=1396 RepID=UPI000BF9C6E2|nr:MFS transporter [Bacillus cereus]PES12322.1 MFS transporter [Bacillus cereus]PEX16921.1 MFS transporter [Bacillus cereus]PFC35640.1 MFS transporter [Bacillus cereus]PFQ72106.1 MFS transporter [Bacillus cereus]PFU10111.1 MFS transporter [Bacillus cereus]